MSSFEIAKDFTMPLEGNNLKTVPGEVIEGHSRLPASRKLRRILKSS